MPCRRGQHPGKGREGMVRRHSQNPGGSWTAPCWAARPVWDPKAGVRIQGGEKREIETETQEGEVICLRAQTSSRPRSDLRYLEPESACGLPEVHGCGSELPPSSCGSSSMSPWAALCRPQAATSRNSSVTLCCVISPAVCVGEGSWPDSGAGARTAGRDLECVVRASPGQGFRALLYSKG